MNLEPTHYREFKNNILKIQNWSGNNIQNYIRGIDNESFENLLEYYPDKHLTRENLFDLAKNNMITTEICLNSILIWGGIKRNHFRMMLQHKNKWITACENIRNNNLNRNISYKSFEEIRSSGSSGIGPAYFTKLIYFLNSKSDKRGYIMDQWTARSINLLSNKKLVKLTKSGNSYYVNDNNNSDIYEEFCNIIEKISCDINVSTDCVELSLFSNGGRSKGNWRNYVIQNHSE